MSPMKFWVTQPNKQHAVKLTQLKLELGLFGARLGAANDKVAFEITGIATKKEKSKPKTTPLPLVPFSKRRHTHCHTTCSRRFLSSKSPSLVWDARDLCGFHLLHKSQPFLLQTPIHISQPFLLKTLVLPQDLIWKSFLLVGLGDQAR